MEIVAIVVRKHFYLYIVCIFLRLPQSITNGLKLEKITKRQSMPYSFHILNNKLCMFKQVILRSVGDIFYAGAHVLFVHS
jgi:hypothetical protein